MPAATTLTAPSKYTINDYGGADALVRAGPPGPASARRPTKASAAGRGACPTRQSDIHGSGMAPKLTLGAPLQEAGGFLGEIGQNDIRAGAAN